MNTVFQSAVDFNAGYRNTSRGESYCHSVFRCFRSTRHSKDDVEMSVDALMKICPLPAEQVKAILESGKTLSNTFTDVWMSKPADRETWEWGNPYCNNWQEKEIASLDGQWYKDHTYAEWEKKFKKLFGPNSI